MKPVVIYILLLCPDDRPALAGIGPTVNSLTSLTSSTIDKVFSVYRLRYGGVFVMRVKATTVAKRIGESRLNKLINHNMACN